MLKDAAAKDLETELDQDYEALSATADEWGQEEIDEPLSEADRIAIEQEIEYLDMPLSGWLPP